MKVSLQKIGPIAFEATADSGHSVVMDGSPDNGGDNMGSRPMEMMLMGLGGCSGIDVALILQKGRQQVSDCRIEIEGQRADAVPAVFTDIHVHFTITGKQLDPKKVARAISLSMEKYCSVTRMLEASVNITHDFNIVEQ
jgi:putative redox protein